MSDDNVDLETLRSSALAFIYLLEKKPIKLPPELMAVVLAEPAFAEEEIGEKDYKGDLAEAWLSLFCNKHSPRGYSVNVPTLLFVIEFLWRRLIELDPEAQRMDAGDKMWAGYGDGSYTELVEMLIHSAFPRG